MNNEPTNEELAAASGEGTYRAPRSLDLNQVSINGDADAKEVDGKLQRVGGYFRKHVIVGKPKDAKPEEVHLGKSIRVVFLKIRRKLVERGEKGKVLLSTDEHNDKRDAVTLYFAETKEQKRGTAEDLRLAYPNLRTVQIVYALLLSDTEEPELVRLVIKGSSLGSEAKKGTGVQDFYSYVSSFPKQDHMWEYETELHPVIEQGAKSYYTIDFRRGKKLDGDMLSLAKRTLLDVAMNCKDVDAARAAKFVGAQKPEPAAPPEQGRSEDDFAAPGIDYPKEDINPDDIPF